MTRRVDENYTTAVNECDLREVLVGKSDVAQAWTDGETFIAIDQDVLRDVLAGKLSLGFLISVMVHEFSHVEPDQGGHIHSMEFYKRFHDLMILPHLAERLRYILVTAYSKAIDELGKKPNQVFLAEIRRINKKMKHSLADMTVYAAGGPIILDLGEEAE